MTDSPRRNPFLAQALNNAWANATLYGVVCSLPHDAFTAPRPGFFGSLAATLLTTELEELYPVVPDQTNPLGFGSPRPARFALTESGRRSLLTRLETQDDQNENVWNSLPGFQWYSATLRAKIGTEVLAIHSNESTRFGRVPLIATRTAGTGKQAHGEVRGGILPAHVILDISIKPLKGGIQLGRQAEE